MDKQQTTVHVEAQNTRDNTLRKVKKAALAALLIPLATAGSAQAFEGPDYSSRVDSTVVQDNSIFTYSFTVVNTSDSNSGANTATIVDWELPIWDINDVANITSPQGWVYEIISPTASTDYYNNGTGPYGYYSWDWVPSSDPTLVIDPNAYGPNPSIFETPPLIIHWYTLAGIENLPTNPIFPQNQLDGFGFTSQYAAYNAPYMSSWFFLPSRVGDPPIPGGAVGLPASPAFLNAVPEPGSMLVLATGLGAMVGLIRRKTT